MASAAAGWAPQRRTPVTAAAPFPNAYSRPRRALLSAARQANDRPLLRLAAETD